MKKFVLYIAMSIDGYIAKHDDDISWLSIVEREGEDYGYHDFIQSVDTVILGRKTYAKVMSMTDEFPHKHKKTYILSRTPKANEGNIEYYNGDIAALLEKIRKENTMQGIVFCDGGADIVQQCLQTHLFDTIIISIIPILLGGGIHLFSSEYPLQRMELVRSATFPSGLVQVWYKKYEE
jgi:dihydrofolate reductase